jgi:hypothetical protein
MVEYLLSCSEISRSSVDESRIYGISTCSECVLGIRILVLMSHYVVFGIGIGCTLGVRVEGDLGWASP